MNLVESLRLRPDRKSARHTPRRQMRQVARSRIGERAHVNHELVHQSGGEHDAIQQRVSLRQDASGVVEHGGPQCWLELRRIVCLELHIRLAVVLDEALQRHDRAVVTIRTGQLHIAQRRGAEAVLIGGITGHVHAPEIVAQLQPLILARADLRHGDVVKLIVTERGAGMTDRALEREKGARTFELLRRKSVIAARKKAVPWRVVETQFRNEESRDRVGF